MIRHKIMSCITCGKETKIALSQFTISGRGRYCSRECKFPAKIKSTCIFCSKERMLSPSFIRKGADKYCSYLCKSEHYKIIKKGNNNPAWRGGTTTRAHSIRTSDKYLNMKKESLKRDKYTCQVCGVKTKLETHHVVPLWKLISENPKDFDASDDYFHDIENLQTLCQKCHRKVKV